MLKEYGETHSKMKIDIAATWIQTNRMITHVEYSKGSRKAVGERTPLRIFTMIDIPVSRKGREKSMSRARSEFSWKLYQDFSNCKNYTFNEVTHISALLCIRSAISPFHPFSVFNPHFSSRTLYKV